MALVSPIADYVVAIGLDGKISSQGSLSNALAKDSILLEEVTKEAGVLEEATAGLGDESSVPAKEIEASAGKLVVAEDVAVGHVSWSACRFSCGLQYVSNLC